ncbi:MAG TPA: host-nuclease inhibitor Gam family protein [Candidatus Binataceae bacterium]|nr:host-nuclease inhibitor Gam family protein [Candidatus Binataceae bacterium]
MAKKVRTLKAAATEVSVPQTREDANAALTLIGVHQRARQRIETEMNERLAAVREDYERRAQPHKNAIELRINGLHVWCEAHREELLSADLKTCRFAAGEVSWRMRPPRVTVRDTMQAIAWFVQNHLTAFVRQREELNREEMLRLPGDAARNPFVKIGSGGEEFYVRPFETELEEVA